MSRKSLSGKELRRAAALVEAAMLSALPEAETAFSPAFEEKMAPLLRRAKRCASVRRALQAAAVFFLALLAGATVYLAAVPEARASVVSWIRESFVGRTVFRFSGEEETGSLPNYRPTWLPEGFELAEEVDNGHVHMLIYRSPSKACPIMISWLYMTEGSGLTIIETGDKYQEEQVFINGHSGELRICLSNEEPNDMMWIDDAHNCLLSIESDLEANVILHIGENIILED